MITRTHIYIFIYICIFNACALVSGKMRRAINYSVEFFLLTHEIYYFLCCHSIFSFLFVSSGFSFPCKHARIHVILILVFLSMSYLELHGLRYDVSRACFSFSFVDNRENNEWTLAIRSERGRDRERERQTDIEKEKKNI